MHYFLDQQASLAGTICQITLKFSLMFNILIAFVYRFYLRLEKAAKLSVFMRLCWPDLMTAVPW